MESLLSGQFGMFFLVIIAFYSGELVWAERDAGLGQLYDATPVTNATTLLAKFSAMVTLIAMLLGLTMVVGIATQASRGYYRFEIPLYLQALIEARWPRNTGLTEPAGGSRPIDQEPGQ